VVVSAIPLTDIGWKAGTALSVTGGRARVFALLSASIYLTAGDEIVWLGRAGDILHPRAMLTAHALPVAGETIALDMVGARPWRPGGARVNVAELAASARALLVVLRAHPDQMPTPRGLGALLVGRVPPFPLEHAVSSVANLARACEMDDASEALVFAEGLLGLGPGLTPSGDDFMGGVLFARRLIGSAAWPAAAAALVERARERTNQISLALLSDLADGHGHEPLHALGDALGQGAVGARAFDAIRRLDRLGHTSGWDMLAGLLVGLVGRAALAPPV
jgi:hypothetical protein